MSFNSINNELNLSSSSLVNLSKSSSVSSTLSLPTGSPLTHQNNNNNNNNCNINNNNVNRSLPPRKSAEDALRATIAQNNNLIKAQRVRLEESRRRLALHFNYDPQKPYSNNQDPSSNSNIDPFILLPARKRPYGRIVNSTPESILWRIASMPEDLVPIRLDLEFDGIKLRDIFTWSLSEFLYIPNSCAMIARGICEDLNLPLELFLKPISDSISEQTEDFRLSRPSVLQRLNNSGQGIVIEKHSEDEKENDSITFKISPAWLSKDSNVNTQPIDNKKDKDIIIKLPKFKTKNDNVTNLDAPDLRTIIKLDITISNKVLIDQFEWDLNCKRNDPELFAENMCTELRLPTEFRTAIAHSIREQLQFLAKSLFIVDHKFDDDNPIVEDAVAAYILPTIKKETVRRSNADIAIYGPQYDTVSQQQLEKLEKECDRDSRRKRRQTQRSRRTMALPEKESYKTKITERYIPVETDYGNSSNISGNHLDLYSHHSRSGKVRK